MSLKTNFLLNNNNVSTPNNYKELSIELNFDNDENNQSVSITEWEFGVGIQNSNDGAYATNDFIGKGLIGGVGVGEGMPFELQLEYGGNIETLFDGYIDLWDATIDCEKVTATATEKGGVDWLRGAANGVTFEYLYEEAKTIKESDFVSVPYVINSIPNYRDVILMLLTIFVTVQTIKKEITDLNSDITDAANPITGITGVLKVVLRVLYIATLLITVIKLILDVVKLIIQPIKYHKGMYLKTLAEKGAEYFGLEFKSSILDSAPFNKAVILPQKFQTFDDKEGVFGFTNSSTATDLGYFSGTYGGFLQLLKTMFNGKIIMSDGVLRLERKDYTTSSPKYILPNVERNSYTLNKEDFISNLFIEFQTDLNDKNTIQEYDGTAAQIQTTYKNVTNKDMVLLSGFQRQSIPLALGKRKTELTVPEKFVKTLGKVIDPVIGALITVVNAVIKVINALIKAISKLVKALKKIGIKLKFEPEPIKEIKYTPLAELIDNRIDMLKVENDWLNTPKIILIDEKSTPRNTKLNSSNESVLNSLYLYNNFWFVNSFDSSINGSNANQYKKYEVDVPFCYDDYLLVKNDNALRDGDSTGKIDSLLWNVDAQRATIKYRINELYSDNFKTKIIDSKTGNTLV